MKKKIIGLLSFLFVVSSLFSFQNSTAYANDDITGITLETEMRDMINQGVMKGYSEGEYRPGEQINRGQFAALLSRALKLPEGTPKFSDVQPTATLAGDIYRASEAGIVNGYADGTFGMNDSITRDQMAKMIDNALVYLNIERKETTLTFSDVGEIGATFKEAVARTVYDEIVRGIPNGDGTFRFAPKKTATRAEAAAFISRMLNVAETDIEEEPQPPVEEEPVPEEETDVYKVATIDANKNLVPGTQSYDTYNEAKGTVTDPNQVVVFNDEIVNMPAGLVISSPPAGKYLTYVYADQNFTTNFTYITAQQEMEFLESTDEYVKVNLAGKTAYVKQSEVDLLPYQQVDDRNYYSINGDGDLVHNIYNQKTKAKSSYVIGKAPAFLTAGNKYYSWDGGVFYNNSGVEVGEGYQYFNYLPARTVSNYSAEELDRYINARLAELESLYQTNPTTFARYKDATELSKLKDLGAYLKEAESKYKINALLILAMAMHESDYGMSVFSQERNNLFGLKAYDSSLNEAEVFADPREAIDGLATRYLNKNYINPNPDPATDYANGAVLGNKSRGFNMKYASDSYWGQKIAGHMYRVDKFLGGKDLGKYTIGLTNTSDLNVRHDPTVTPESEQFKYKKAGMPIVKLDSSTQADGSVWYKVISDDYNYNEGYIYSIYVEDMKIVK